MAATPLYYEVTGSGEPLLLVHAGIADASMWDEQVAAFAADYQVIRFDAQGFGRSPTAAAPATRADDIAELLQTLGVERAHIVGLSAGGGAAIDFAVTRPRMVGALVLIAAGLGGFEGTDPWLDAQDERETELIEQGDFDAATELSLRVWLAGPRRQLADIDPRLVDRLRPLVHDALMRQVGRQPTPQIDRPAVARLSAIRASTLVLIGDHDADVVRQAADFLAQQIPGAELRVLADTAHMVNLERPREFNAVLRAFLEAHPLA